MTTHDNDKAHEAAERELFEAHVREKLGAEPALLYHRTMPGALFYGEYVNEKIQRHWLGWLARSALTASEAKSAELERQNADLLLALQQAKTIEDILRGQIKRMEAQQNGFRPDFLLNGTRFKLTFNGAGNCTSMQNYAKELAGQWVALVPAADDSHLARPAAANAGDRAMLEAVSQDLEISTWQCPRCGHAEDCKDMDAASMLRDYLRPAAKDAGDL